ncbi:hypothetical protein [Aquimarina algiphila]|uniref:hypothetical protein n=1 Tax=Aquimarina algiphila TaxID=2047982 RepID=UPI00232EBC29|nr:hypothetical protein [Aquimarina algiphila]
MKIRLLFFSSLFCFISYGQLLNKNNPDYYNWFDTFIGIENTGLYNGVLYTEKYNLIHKKHQFFNSSDFIPGSVSYEGKEYYGLMIKYNIYEDKVLIKLSNKFGVRTLQLISSNVDNFSISDHKFVNIRSEISTTKESGFYEVLTSNDRFVFYKKHQKIKKELFKEDRLLYDFLDRESYFLFYNDSYYSIRTKSELNRVFPELKKDITTFYNANKTVRKSNSDMFWILLMKKIHSLISNNNNSIKE